jgi:subtilisin family serine protease
VIGVSAVGPSTFKADYSNWGEHNDVAAPGGYFRDFAGTPQNRVPGNLVLSAEPLNVAQALGDIDANGDPTSPFVLKSCKGKKCAYYQYLQGTSMASPHAVGVAALIISTFGRKDHGGLTMNPDAVAGILERTATDHPCPDPPVLDYTIPGRDRDASFNATCVGTAAKNSIWGDGIVDALAASRR